MVPHLPQSGVPGCLIFGNLVLIKIWVGADRRTDGPPDRRIDRTIVIFGAIFENFENFEILKKKKFAYFVIF